LAAYSLRESVKPEPNIQGAVKSKPDFLVWVKIDELKRGGSAVNGS